ncbi:MAG: PQQ-binding-like beta-propeller repeat protein [Acidobacteriota bacterium]|nr:PQQ-binding-like beta-propeller repeat protein [Acidobacteriota bacterium]
MKTRSLLWAAAVALLLMLVPAVLAQDNADWPRFGNDPGNSKYSPLDQIDATNFERVTVAWTWESVDSQMTEDDLPRGVRAGQFKAIPIVIGGRMFVPTALGQVAAVDAATGETLWSFDSKSYEAGRPANLGFQHRGVAHWQKGAQARVLMPLHDRRLLSLDAETGRPDPDFGEDGFVEMTKDLGREIREARTTHSSPPTVCLDTVIVGSIVSDLATHKEAPPGFVRAYSVVTGDLAWVFRTIPQEGEEGNETWEEGSWRYSGNTNVWSMIAVDEELGMAYLPIGTPTNDLYGGHRKGDNLFAESIVAVDCATGEKKWHFQTVHHGLWDYDLPTAPNLIDVQVDGKTIKAVAQVTKQAFAFVFDRVTGEPLWSIEERAVAASDVPGERASPTQPFPTKPAAFDRQGVSVDDLIDFTPELREEALEIASQYELVPFFTPPRLGTTGKPRIQLPSDGGGANWTGAAVDPTTGMLYVPSYTRPVSVTLTTPDPNRSNLRYTPDRWYAGVEGPQGLPIVKPPYARITAIDLKTGDHAWVVPHGDGPRNHPAIKHLELGRLGASAHVNAPLVTETLLFVTKRAESTTGAEGSDPDSPAEVSVYDKTSGEYLGGIELPSTPNGNLITYAVDGRQFLAVSVGGGSFGGGSAGTTAMVVALALGS